ncbi:CheR family methyltransferase [Gloeocapsopsis dulcis]|uniref:protein-glutamate O-methyltransferase n=1 Tax=Gloeocapsopsis dulcis AAB1 = 1H9 TaxID=1433147 RepID=A0A6N8FWB7_9CHRO|nr:CheR family methyltransferase [Gloeocapsopsis dulcis]MUL37420.1 chemotaxis protein CheR [Gloeocapsopsis dulcis AAB1 = 1H9]WNN87394.1 CheR family methyltransferase [Gloeocapsopsis dulcis]
MNPEFEALLNYIKRNRGFDFTGYKRSSLERRVQKRMQEIEVDGYNNYIDYLEVHPQEFVCLFNTILINVTSFFRDLSVWEYVAAEVIPQIISCKELPEPIRIWSAGCASGQEAYTLAIILAEAIGVEQFRSRVKIYATDVDEEALNQGRYATYNEREVTDLSAELLERYFERYENLYIFRKDLRRSVIFGRHDLVQDAPISRIDLLICRNALMYFNAEAQAKILSRFHFALNDSGYLLLGKAEMLLSHSMSFSAVDLKCRVFTKVATVNTRDRLLLMNPNNNDENTNYLTSYGRLRNAAFDITPLAQLILDLDGVLVLANERARTLFSLSYRDIGRLLQDLELSYRPLDLRQCINQVYSDRRLNTYKDVEWTTGEDTQYFDVQVVPLLDINGVMLGVSITFNDVTRAKHLQEELEHSNQELEMAHEELQTTNEELETTNEVLQTTNEELETTNEELETTNEELQSSNEELETTNEELQSTNEELETMNEELHSSNEELQTINEKLRLRSEELNSVNAFLASILTSFRCGVVVLDRHFLVQVWSDKAEDLWGLRPLEVQGQHFLNLDIGLPIEQIRQPIRTCLAAESEYVEIILDAVNRRGKLIQCKVTCTPLLERTKEIRGVILLMEEQASE